MSRCFLDAYPVSLAILLRPTKPTFVLSMGWMISRHKVIRYSVSAILIQFMPTLQACWGSP